MSDDHVSARLCFTTEYDHAMAAENLLSDLVQLCRVFNPEVKYSVPRVIKLLYSMHLLHI